MHLILEIIVWSLWLVAKMNLTFCCYCAHLQTFLFFKQIQIDYLPGLTLLQTTGPIYYVNADAFRDWLIYSTGFNPYNQLAKMESTKSDAGTSGRRCSALRSFGKRLMNRGRQRDHRANSSTYEMDEVKKECSASLQWVRCSVLWKLRSVYPKSIHKILTVYSPVCLLHT